MVEWECLIKPREASGLDPEAVHAEVVFVMGSVGRSVGQ
jgi:hypothetical protein